MTLKSNRFRRIYFNLRPAFNITSIHMCIKNKNKNKELRKESKMDKNNVSTSNKSKKRVRTCKLHTHVLVIQKCIEIKDVVWKNKIKN